MKLLIVEDNDEMRALLKSVIADLAETIIECCDGDQALTNYRQHRPDFVLMDIRMKRLDGIAATRQITAAFPNAAIVMVTDYDDARLRKAARAAGACGYVVKENILPLRKILLKSQTAEEGEIK
jgi:DNA-binding NarL/FixJ family response regulator